MVLRLIQLAHAHALCLPDPDHVSIKVLATGVAYTGSRPMTWRPNFSIESIPDTNGSLPVFDFKYYAVIPTPALADIISTGNTDAAPIVDVVFNNEAPAT